MCSHPKTAHASTEVGEEALTHSPCFHGHSLSQGFWGLVLPLLVAAGLSSCFRHHFLRRFQHIVTHSRLQDMFVGLSARPTPSKQPWLSGVGVAVHGFLHCTMTSCPTVWTAAFCSGGAGSNWLLLFSPQQRTVPPVCKAQVYQ